MNRKKRKTEKKVTISVALPKGLHDRVHQRAVRQQTAQAAVMRQALQAHLDDERDPVNEAATRLDEAARRLDAVADRVVVAVARLGEKMDGTKNETN